MATTDSVQAPKAAAMGHQVVSPKGGQACECPGDSIKRKLLMLVCEFRAHEGPLGQGGNTQEVFRDQYEIISGLINYTHKGAMARGDGLGCFRRGNQCNCRWPAMQRGSNSGSSGSMQSGSSMQTGNSGRRG